jgi:DNA-binding NarL/FixJ family response regulator
LLAREVELAQLSAALDRTFAGRGGLVLLTGEPGIGKTRLAEHVASAAQVRGAAVYWGYATQAEGAPPYWPWRQILRSLLEDFGEAEFIRLASSGIAEILHVVPELRARLNVVGIPTDEDVSRFAIYDSVGELLFGAARRQPVILVLEDLHWADSPSVVLLQVLGSRLPRAPLLIIATYRDREVGSEHPLKAGLADFVRTGDTLEVALHGLDNAAAAELLRRLTPFEPAPDLVRRLQAQTAGNPFFLTQLARTLRDDTDQRPGAIGALPSGVAAVLQRSLERLSRECQQFLRIAAVANDSLNLELLVAATGIGSARLLELCSEAADGGVLTRRNREFAFTHGLFRDVVSNGLSPGRCAEVHTLLGRALEQQSGGAEPRLTQVAYHYAEAASIDDSQRQAAFKYGIAAARAVSSDLAYEQAARHYEVGLAFADSLEPAARAGLLIELGRSKYQASDVDGALAAGHQAAQLATQLDDPDLLARAALVVHGVGGPVYTEAVAKLCEPSLRNPPRDSSLRIQVLSQMTVALMQSVDPGAFGRALEHSAEAMRRAETATDPDAVFAALHARQMARSGPDGVEERLALAEQTLQLAGRTGRLVYKNWGHSWRADALAQLGRIDEAQADVLEQARTADELREPLHRWRSLVTRATIAQYGGDFRMAREFAEKARELGSGAHRTIAEFNYIMHVLTSSELTGERERSFELIDTFQGQYPLMTAPIALRRVTMLASAGQLAEARIRLSSATLAPGNIRPMMAWLPAMAILVDAVTAVGATDVAPMLYEALLPYGRYAAVTGAGLVSLTGSVERYLGKLAVTLQRWESAARHYAAAVAFEEQAGSPPYAACAKILYAELLLLRGAGDDDLRKARRFAEEALATTQALEMRPWSDRANAVVAALSARHVADHPLSRREMEVALLVAEGLSNRAIAEHLHLSERTAESHVKNICDKLGFNSRAQVAGWVATRTPSSSAGSSYAP